MSAALDRVDIHHAARYAREGYPWEDWDLLRREAPVYWYEREDVEPFWAITRHEDILAVSKRPDVFINGGPRLRLCEKGELELGRLGPEARARAKARGWDPDEPSDFVFMDDPRHRKFRLPASRSFTPARMRAQAAHFDELARGFADEFSDAVESQSADGGRCDFVSEFAIKLPIAAIGEMLGLPPTVWKKIFKWTNALVGEVLPEDRREGESEAAAVSRFLGEFRRFLEQRIRERRAAGCDRDDLFDTIVAGRVDGEPFTEQQLIGYLILIVSAGNETTRNATSGGVIALIEHPEQRDLLCAHPELLDTAVEEILRWTSPVIQFLRTATRDFELRGTTIRRGDTVGVFYPSGNRDERVFEDPYRFDITRDPNRHLAFGHGAHFCLGANLARAELRAALGALLPVLPRLELAGEPRRIPNLHVSGYATLPVRTRQM